MDYKKIFRRREFRLKLINCLKIIPKKPYLKIVYKIKTGKKQLIYACFFDFLLILMQMTSKHLYVSQNMRQYLIRFQ